nr:hypothetical protein [Tanacetum cinerariifolium]
MDQRMNEAVKVAFQIQSDRLRDEAQAENDEFLKTIDENMQKIIKEKVKEQVKTSYAVATDLSEMELKKILIEKMEGNKSIHRSNEQRNLYKCNTLKFVVPLTCVIFELSLRSSSTCISHNHPCCGVLPSCEVVTLGPACPHYLEHNSLRQSYESCVVGLLAVIDNEFEV